MQIQTAFRSFRSFVLLALTVPFVACSAADETQSEKEEAQLNNLCDTICDRQLECNSSVDPDICRARCAPISDALTNMRGDVIRSTTRCFAGLDCRQVTNSDSLSICLEDSAALVTPTDAAVRFCDRLVSRLSDCDSAATGGRAACIDSTKLYSEEALNRLITCTEKACNLVNECLGSVLGVET